jgi:nucleoside 2-deoxyribosyltransferase
MHRLKNQRVYLAGAIDRVKDRGKGWRENITPFLEDLGITVFDPLKKHGTVGLEDDIVHKQKKQLKAAQMYDDLSSLMKDIRRVDLRLVDISDFLIISLDLGSHPCGTYEELFLANRQKKPIILHMTQGKENTPDWLFGTIPHQMIFSCWDGVKDYLVYIDQVKDIKTLDRWYFVNENY